MINNNRLRIATRIHFALLRQLGEGIDVGTMLKNRAEAREVLWVCDALGDVELSTLARQYRRAEQAEKQAANAAGGHTAQDTAWAKDSSGFGLSQPPALPRVASAAKPSKTAKTDSTGWLNPSNWLRRGHHPTR